MQITKETHFILFIFIFPFDVSELSVWNKNQKSFPCSLKMCISFIFSFVFSGKFQSGFKFYWATVQIKKKKKRITSVLSKLSKIYNN